MIFLLVLLSAVLYFFPSIFLDLTILFFTSIFCLLAEEVCARLSPQRHLDRVLQCKVY